MYCYISHLPLYSKYEPHASFSSDLFESDKVLNFYNIVCCSVQVHLINSYLKNCLDYLTSTKQEIRIILLDIHSSNNFFQTTYVR